jgi:hypothetical protein
VDPKTQLATSSQPICPGNAALQIKQSGPQCDPTGQISTQQLRRVESSIAALNQTQKGAKQKNTVGESGAERAKRIASYVAITLQTGNTLPPIHTTDQLVRVAAEESYGDWLRYREGHPSSHKKLNFDRVSWETESLVTGALQGDKVGLDTDKYYCPEHPSQAAWWWANKCDACNKVFNARRRHLKRLRPSLTEPLLALDEATASFRTPVPVPVVKDKGKPKRKHAQQKFGIHTRCPELLYPGTVPKIGRDSSTVHIPGRSPAPGVFPTSEGAG